MLVELPTEIFEYILKYFPIETILRLKYTCKTIKQRIDSKQIWKWFTDQDLGPFIKDIPEDVSYQTYTYYFLRWMRDQMKEIVLLQTFLHDSRTDGISIHFTTISPQMVFLLPDLIDCLQSPAREKDIANKLLRLKFNEPFIIKANEILSDFCYSNYLIRQHNADVTAIQGGLRLQHHLTFHPYVSRLSPHILPKILQELPQLEFLSLREHRLYAWPQELSKLTKLRLLHLDNNRLQNIPQEINQLSCLTELDLSNNRLESFPLSLLQLTQLTHLRLGNHAKSNEAGNCITDLPAAITKLTELTVLNLENTNLKNIPDEIYYLPKLESVDIRKNPIKKLPAIHAPILKMPQFYI